MTVSLGMWRVLGASVAGAGHRRHGAGCQDAHTYRQLDDGALLVAVADGAGSASRAAEGAACAVRIALDSVAAALGQPAEYTEAADWQALLGTALQDARAALEEMAGGSGPHPPTPRPLRVSAPHGRGGDSCSPPPELAEGPGVGANTSAPILRLHDFATTLLLAVVTTQWVAVAQVGDGAAVIHDAAGVLQSLTVPDHGEYLNETVFVTSSDYLERAQYATYRHDGLRGVALLTDGLEMLALDLATNAAHAPFFAPLFAFAAVPDATEEELTAFLDSERVCARTDDDKTLVLAVRV